MASRLRKTTSSKYRRPALAGRFATRCISLPRSVSSRFRASSPFLATREKCADCVKSGRRNTRGTRILQYQSPVILATAPGFRAFEETEGELQALRTKQSEQHRLDSAIAGAAKNKTEFDEKRKAAASQAATFAHQKQNKEQDRNNVREKAEAIRDRLSGSQPEFDWQNNLANRATRSISDIRHFVSTVTAVIADGDQILQTLKDQQAAFGAKDASAVQTAQLLEESASETFQLLGRQLAAATAERDTLATQLQKIGGGICPFLKEQCRQFDPSKVEGDLKEKSAAVESLRTGKNEAETAFRAAQRALELRRNEDRASVEIRSKTEQRIAGFLSAFDRLAWVDTREKAGELRHWIQELDSMPARPKAEISEVDLEGFEATDEWRRAFSTLLTDWWHFAEEIRGRWNRGRVTRRQLPVVSCRESLDGFAGRA